MITSKNKISLSFLAILTAIILAGITSSLIIVNSGIVDFSSLNEPTETTGEIIRPVALTQQDGTVQESNTNTVTCPARTSINGHSDIRVSNVVIKKNHAPNLNNPASLFKNMKGVVAWEIYGGCGDDRLHIRASAGNSFDNSTAISILDQINGINNGGSCKSIPQAELPINVLDKIAPLNILSTGDNWVSLAAYATGNADTDNAEFYSCIYTSCDYDSDGLTSQSCGGTDTDDFVPQLDTTPPGRITNLVFASSTTSSITWTWTNPTDPDFSKVLISIDGQNVANSSSTSYTATNLQSGQSYQISIRTQDTTGNINQNAVTSGGATTFQNTGDTTAPIITGITTNPPSPFVNNGSQQNVQVNFTSNEYPIIVNFQILNSTGQVTTRGPFALTSSASLPLTLVVPANLSIGAYTIRMTATDNASNSAQYPVGSFTVISANDTTAPAPITNLQATNITSSSITWTWTNPTGDFSRAIIYLNGQNVANTSSTSYTATNLQSDRSYTITINTQDTTGNINTTPVSNTARTLSDDTNDDNDSSTTKKKKHKSEIFADYTPIVQNKTQLFEEQETISLKPKKQSNYSFLILMLGIGILLLIILIIIALLFKASR